MSPTITSSSGLCYQHVQEGQMCCMSRTLDGGPVYREERYTVCDQMGILFNAGWEAQWMSFRQLV